MEPGMDRTRRNFTPEQKVSILRAGQKGVRCEWR